MKEYIIKVKVLDPKRKQRDCEWLIDDIIHQGLRHIACDDYGIIEVLLKGVDYK